MIPVTKPSTANTNIDSNKVKNVYVLIDFNNLFGNSVERWTEDNLNLEISGIINLVCTTFPEVEKIYLRLYGGWFKENLLTNQASIIQQILPNLKLFPKIKDKQIIQGGIELATCLFSLPDFVWGHTYKEKKGIPRLRFDKDKKNDFCDNNNFDCPHYILYRITQKKDKYCKVVGCGNMHKDVFIGLEQKMVDTLIACDLISISKELPNGIVLISDDFDHLPALASASANTNSEIILGIKNSESLQLISSLLKQFRIKIAII